jgi:hypothetical protein
VLVRHARVVQILLLQVVPAPGTAKEKIRFHNYPGNDYVSRASPRWGNGPWSSLFCNKKLARMVCSETPLAFIGFHPTQTATQNEIPISHRAAKQACFNFTREAPQKG